MKKVRYLILMVMCLTLQLFSEELDIVTKLNQAKEFNTKSKEINSLVVEYYTTSNAIPEYISWFSIKDASIKECVEFYEAVMTNVPYNENTSVILINIKREWKKLKDLVWKN